MGVERDTAWRGPFLVMAMIVLASSCHDWPPCGGATCPITEWEAELSGGNQVPPVTSSALATAGFELHRAGDSLVYRITVSTLPATAIISATLHRGSPGDTAAATTVAVGLCGTGGSAPACASLTAPGILIHASFPITPAQLNTIRSFGYYANVSTAGHPSGEIRAQVRNVAP